MFKNICANLVFYQTTRARYARDLAPKSDKFGENGQKREHDEISLKIIEVVRTHYKQSECSTTPVQI